MPILSSESLLAESKQQRNERFTSQLYQAAAKGFLQGTLVALVTGYALSYKYNRGKNVPFFRNVYKVWWFVGWAVVGVTFATDSAKMKISKQAAMEDEIKRARYLEEELNGHAR
ncbi:hypothetical protein Cantr_09909 [Candida viswanathii]|uniref:Uncharacterized protein n=1 Tax=Candida viswanathii TaxID=5486 RepID=A0A367YCS6_9ASCO|nr:hypothetical protein Cantr_09909 [Candida viswanathii]